MASSGSSRGVGSAWAAEPSLPSVDIASETLEGDVCGLVQTLKELQVLEAAHVAGWDSGSAVDESSEYTRRVKACLSNYRDLKQILIGRTPALAQTLQTDEGVEKWLKDEYGIKAAIAFLSIARGRPNTVSNEKLIAKIAPLTAVFLTAGDGFHNAIYTRAVMPRPQLRSLLEALIQKIEGAPELISPDSDHLRDLRLHVNQLKALPSDAVDEATISAMRQNIVSAYSSFMSRTETFGVSHQ